MIRRIRSVLWSEQARRLACFLFLAEAVLLPLLALAPTTVFADDCNRDWTRAED
ncbi:MAG: hypothetical protein ACE15E_19305 [Acidobacteriota bacterium]